MSSDIQLDEQKTLDVTGFIEKVKRYTQIQELTPEILHEFIQKILIHQSEKIAGKKYQQIDIYYNSIGIIDIPTSEFEMEELFQEHIQNKRKTA